MPSKRNEGRFRTLSRQLVNTVPPLKIVLYVNDLICYLFSLIIDGVSYILRNSYRLTLFVGSRIFKPIYEIVSNGFSRLLLAIPAVRNFREKREQAKYERLQGKRNKKELHQEPIPYSDQLIKRSITYHGALLLALFLYVFIYFVLIKHHTYVSVSVAFLLLLVYLILIENSHNLRSILMLCLPIMFTNRGRALIFCSMLTLLSTGPIKSLQHNVKEIHSSLICCKQYLLVKSDRYVGENVVNKLVRVEEMIVELVTNIKQMAREIRYKFDGIIELALRTEDFIVDTIRKLKQIVNLCNHHTNELNANCLSHVDKLSANCRNLFNPFNFQFCKVFGSLKEICGIVKLPQALCELPQHVVEFFERTIGDKLAEYMAVIEREFHVDIDVKRQYEYNVTKSKSFAKVSSEIKFDVESKFWYIHVIRRVFNLVSLILVVWIFSTATLYHMHYLSEIHFDNMYLDERLGDIEDLRKLGALKLKNEARGRKEADELALERPTVRSADSTAREPNAKVDQNNNIGDKNKAQSNSTRGRFDYDDNLATVRSSESGQEGEGEDEENPIADQRGQRRRLLATNREFDPLIESPADSSGSDDVYAGTADDTRNANSNTKKDNNHVEEQTQQAQKQDEQRRRRRQQCSDNRPQSDYLFPMTQAHESHYLKPFTWHMNKTELSKLYWSGLVWSIINGYIMFFLALDYVFYQLIQFLVDTLREILFTSDLPLVDVESKSRDAAGAVNVVKYNRTYLSNLRKQRQSLMQLPGESPSNHSSLSGLIGGHQAGASPSSSSVRGFYDRIMLSIARDIPDDVAILESLEQCLPQPSAPAYNLYKLLFYLALITFGAVIVEAYALRTRHCIANLYYPRRARRRALWLYRKLLSEKPRFDDDIMNDGGQAHEGKSAESSSTRANDFFEPDHDGTSNNVDSASRTRKEQRRERRRQVRQQAKAIGYKLLSDAINRRQ